MRAHFAYLTYVLRHKWFVFCACRRLRVPLWRAVVHDWTKFLPSEWGPYVRTFYAPDGSKRYVESAEFATAWRHHQRRNPHHWQYWLITWDRGNTEPLRMPGTYAREMVADWMGAGRAITGKLDTPAWYFKNRTAIQLHPETRLQVQGILCSRELFETPLMDIEFLERLCVPVSPTAVTPPPDPVTAPAPPSPVRTSPSVPE